MSLACAAFAAAPQAASRLLARSPVPARSHLRCRRPECSLSAPGRPVLHPLLQRANAATVDGVCSAVDVIYAAPDAAWRRFYTLEVLARIPFFAYACLLHLRETLIGPSELATRRLRQHFEQSDNEALHLAVMCVAGRPRWIDRFLAAHLGLVYFGTSVLVFLASPAVAFHFNELVEIHAYDTYDKYIRENERALRTCEAVPLIAKEYYEAENPPRCIESMYDVLVAIRDDELHHSDQLSQYGVEELSGQVRL